MLKKTITAVALAGALTVVAAGAAGAAPAYPAPDAALSCSVATTPVDSTYTCTVGGPDGATAVLSATTSGDNAAIAGTVSSTKTIASNVATYTVTAPSAAGQVGMSATVGGVPTNTTNVAVTAAAGALATTGADNAGLALGAGALLVAGAGAVVVAARRRSSVNA